MMRRINRNGCLGLFFAGPLAPPQRGGASLEFQPRSPRVSIPLGIRARFGLQTSCSKQNQANHLWRFPLKDVYQKQNNHGSALVTVFIFAIVLSGIVVAYLDMVGILHQETAHKMNRYRAINTAEAGINKMVYYLQGVAPDSSTNGSWRGTVTQTEAGQSYTAAVGDLLLEGPAISATSSSGANTPWSVMDASAATYWLSSEIVPQTLSWSLSWTSATSNQWTIYLCRTRMLLGSGSQARFPKDYTWQISTDGSVWTTVVTKTGNTNTDVTDTWTLAQANYIKLNVTQTQWASSQVNIAEVEIYGVVVPATGTSSNALDNRLDTSWSATGLPQSFTLNFLSGSNYSVNKIRMKNLPTALDGFPTTYTLDVYTTSWTNSVAYTQSGAVPDVTATFDNLQTNVNALRINVSAVQGGGNTITIGEIDVPAVCLSARSVVNYPGSRTLSYYTSQHVIVVDGSPPSIPRQPKGNFGIESGT